MMSQDPKETLLYPSPASTGKRLSDPAPQKLEIRKLFLRFCVLLRRERAPVTALAGSGHCFPDRSGAARYHFF